METKHIVTWRKHNDILLSPLTLEELKEGVNKDGKISAKLLIDFNDLVGRDLDDLNDEVSRRITGSMCGLTEIEYKVMGNTANNELVIRVTGDVADHIADNE